MRSEVYNIEPNNIYCGDCLELMPHIADKSVDMVLCDLPYGTTDCQWDSVIPFEPLWEQYRRITKPNAAIVLFGSEPFSSYLRISNIEWFRYDIVWEKTKLVNFAMTGKQPGRTHEMISVFYQHQPTYNPQMMKGEPYKRIGRRICVEESISDLMKQGIDCNAINEGTRVPTTVIKFSNNKAPGTSLHPTQKPVDLLRYLVLTYTNEGDIVLDNTMGSGSTIVAAIKEKRRYIGIEKDEHYFEVAKRRIENELQQLTLF